MQQSSFVWYDLATTDPDAAARFYATAVGWRAEPIPEMHYTILHAGETRAAGLMQLPPHLREAGVPPHWTGYVGVDDVDAMAGRVEAAGGSLKRSPEDIPGVGRFAVVADPGGAVFVLFTPTGAGGPAPAPMTPGHVGWHELHAGDQEAAFAFYAGLFGWTRSRAVDMGPMGTYQIFAYDGLDRGGMMTAMSGGHPAWQFYFAVPGIDAAQSRVQEAGGTVLHGPQEVPGGAWILVCRDPQGAQFALVSATR